METQNTPNSKSNLFFFLPFIFIRWRLITLQYCSGFCHTLTWISHGFTCIPHPDSPLPPPSPPDPSGSSQCTSPEHLSHTSNLGWWCFTLDNIHVSRLFSLNIPPSPSPTESKRQSWEEEWSWRNQPSWLQTLLQSYSHQDHIVLAQKQKYRPMEQDRKPKDNPHTHGHLNFWQRRQEYTMEKR